MKTTKRKAAARAAGTAPEGLAAIAPGIPAPGLEEVRVIERPDGYYWRRKGGAREYGPFATVLEAEADMQVFDDGALEVGETLGEAEAELGISDWIDPETGQPAEEEVSRIEEH